MITVKFNCPHCDRRQVRGIKVNWNQTILLYCDPDAGGCDKYFVSRIELEVKVTNYTLKEKKNGQ